MNLIKMKQKQHTEKYVHLPKRSLGFTILTIVLLFLTIGSFYITIDSWNVLELGSLECSGGSCNYQIHDLMIIPLILINYILIALTICSLVSIFKKLKSYNKEGLIFFSIIGSITFSIIGLTGGSITILIVGLITLLAMGLIAEFI